MKQDKSKSIVNGWGRVFGTSTQRGNDDTALAYDNDSYGVISGYEIAIDNNRAGIFAGVRHEDIASQVKSVSSDTDSVFVGTYGQHTIGKWDLSSSLIAGYEDNSSKRTVLDNLAGYQTASSNYNSVYISPSINLAWTQKLANGIELRPGTQLAYTYGYYGDYKESGTSSNLNFSKRDVGIASGRLQVGLAKTFDKKGEVELRFGTKLRNYSGEDINVSLNGSSASFETAGDNIVFSSYTGVNAHYALNDTLTLNTDVELNRSSGRETSVVGVLGLGIKF